MATQEQLDLFNALVASGDYTTAGQMAASAGYSAADVAAYLGAPVAAVEQYMPAPAASTAQPTQAAPVFKPLEPGGSPLVLESLYGKASNNLIEEAAKYGYKITNLTPIEGTNGIYYNATMADGSQAILGVPNTADLDKVITPAVQFDTSGADKNVTTNSGTVASQYGAWTQPTIVGGQGSESGTTTYQAPFYIAPAGTPLLPIVTADWNESTSDFIKGTVSGLLEVASPLLTAYGLGQGLNWLANFSSTLGAPADVVGQAIADDIAAFGVDGASKAWGIPAQDLAAFAGDLEAYTTLAGGAAPGALSGMVGGGLSAVLPGIGTLPGGASVGSVTSGGVTAGAPTAGVPTTGAGVGAGAGAVGGIGAGAGTGAGAGNVLGNVLNPSNPLGNILNPSAWDMSTLGALLGGLTGALGTETEAQVQEKLPWAEAVPYLKNAMAQASASMQAGSPYASPEQMVAPLTQTQIEANQAGLDTARQQSQWADQVVGGLLPWATGQRLDIANDPIAQNAITAALNPLQQQFTETIMPSITSGAIASGGLGGSRQGVAQGLAAQRYAQAVGDTTSKMSLDLYNRNLQQQIQAASQIPQYESWLQSPYTMGQQVGTQERDYQQALRDAIGKNWQLGQTAMTQGGSLLGQLSGQGGQTVTDFPDANPWVSALGGAISGAQLGKFFGSTK